jgi:D-alanyl-D-alanine carboxypeptidase
MKKLICFLLIAILVTTSTTVFAQGAPSPSIDMVLDYLVLVNKQFKLPDNWEKALQSHLVTIPDFEGDKDHQVERETYLMFSGLRDQLLLSGIQIELDSCYRTVSAQEDLWQRFEKEYGIEYVQKYVAVPGYSEHHTGLAIDICLVKDGVTIDDNDDMIAEREIFSVIHQKLANYGFILRFPEGKEDITGYSYEPWHFRYVGSPEIAHEIMDAGITLEEYLAPHIEAFLAENN